MSRVWSENCQFVDIMSCQFSCQIVIGLVFVVVTLFGFLAACFCKARFGYGYGNQANSADTCTRCQLVNMRAAYCYTGVCTECGGIPSSIATKIVIKGN